MGDPRGGGHDQRERGADDELPVCGRGAVSEGVGESGVASEGRAEVGVWAQGGGAELWGDWVVSERVGEGWGGAVGVGEDLVR